MILLKQEVENLVPMTTEQRVGLDDFEASDSVIL